VAVRHDRATLDGKRLRRSADLPSGEVLAVEETGVSRFDAPRGRSRQRRRRLCGRRWWRLWRDLRDEERAGNNAGGQNREEQAVHRTHGAILRRPGVTV